MAIVLAYHGCTIETARSLLGGSPFKISDNPYDWLGTGAYFWEWDYVRAYEWARAAKDDGGASVVGAAIDLGNCLDLTTRSGTQAVRAAYEDFVASMQQTGEPLPENKDPQRLPHTPGDLSLRLLDRAVITHLQKNMTAAGIDDYGTLRALFQEGEELYPGAGFRTKTHVQIAVRKLELVQGVFRLPDHHLERAGIRAAIY